MLDNCITICIISAVALVCFSGTVVVTTAVAMYGQKKKKDA